MQVVGKALLALVLGLLVANPVCCCTLRTSPAASEAGPPSTGSCCGGGEESGLPDDQPCDHGCPCSKASNALVEHKFPETGTQVFPDFAFDLPPHRLIQPVAGPDGPAFPGTLAPPPPTALWRLVCRLQL